MHFLGFKFSCQSVQLGRAHTLDFFGCKDFEWIHNCRFWMVRFNSAHRGISYSRERIWILNSSVCKAFEIVSNDIEISTISWDSKVVKSMYHLSRGPLRRWTARDKLSDLIKDALEYYRGKILVPQTILRHMMLRHTMLQLAINSTRCHIQLSFTYWPFYQSSHDKITFHVIFF